MASGDQEQAEEEGADAEDVLTPNQGGRSSSRPPEKEIRWVASADVRELGGQGPLEWIDTGSAIPTTVSSSEQTLLPANATPLAPEHLPPLYIDKVPATSQNTRRATHSKAVSGKSTVGHHGLRFPNFQILRLVFDRYLSWADYEIAWKAAGGAAKAITAGDWNGRNIFIRLLRFIRDPMNQMAVAEHFQQDVLDRVNEYRRNHPGFLSLAETACRHDVQLDTAATCREPMLFE